MENHLSFPSYFESLDKELSNLLPFQEFKISELPLRVPNPERCLFTSLSNQVIDLEMERDLDTGEIFSFHEVFRQIETSKNSVSLSREPDPQSSSYIKGNSLNCPFLPAGFESSKSSNQKTIYSPKQILDNGLTTPPGFSTGYHFSETVNLASALSHKIDLWFDEKSNVDSVEEKEVKLSTSSSSSSQDDDVLNISNVQESHPSASKYTWAVNVELNKDINESFIEYIPQMAHSWPFELDSFQKEAILHLERNECVFVAAHTSAGKTVVAEYAIALSRRHMTRTIYTSPIKALSNQKFRDFKEVFSDVGLVTGDIQINPSASCLIMTTEILRSMLYNGSDIIRDLEYVIFDEVHYINDSERGVIWEEVIILLPAHVTLIMLSATVPNTMEFADWVGQTKKKKIYVIATAKRPIPLEHYLYTGSNGKTKNDLFLIQSAVDGKFLLSGYEKAVASKKKTQKSGENFYGSKVKTNYVNPSTEKNILITLSDYLSTHDKLPAVIFTFSRNRCDDNAYHLTSLDLTTSKEKSDIHHFFHKSTALLKGSDKNLPQVLFLEDLLKRGLGIHHSGILPLLKEVVEMLFHRGLVKLLFATETFAMGVNMPTRTVIFDNIQKHDGKHFRNLHSAEYIQMAGRAGRRGLDTTGTVIILVKNKVPSYSELMHIVQGKPLSLESKFRLTYSMILNLLRVEKLRVQDMMKRSFSEFGIQRQHEEIRQNVLKLKESIKTTSSTSTSTTNDENEHHDDDDDKKSTTTTTTNIERNIDSTLISFYDQVSHYFKLKNESLGALMETPLLGKILSPGRFLLIQNELSLQVGVFHGFETGSKGSQKKLSVFLLSDSFVKSGLLRDKDDESRRRRRQKGIERYLNVIRREIWSPENKPSLSLVLHEVEDVIEIFKKEVSFLDLKTWEWDIKNHFRFPEEPYSSSTVSLLGEMIQAKDLVSSSHLKSFSDFKIKGLDIDLQDKLLRTSEIKKEIESREYFESTPDFAEKFKEAYIFLEAKKEIDEMEFLLSEDALSHLPDYHHRLQVLKELKYIDEEKNVQLKGRVACELGNHDLLCTELIFNNVLTDKSVFEIAALLSCIVFQQKYSVKPTLSSSLEEGIEEIKKCESHLSFVQNKNGMKDCESFETLDFGLTQVVYEWAKGLPFSEIIKLTDVHEGVIVRTIIRLDEVLRDIKDAARVIGDPILYQKMEEASSVIKRDIVFAASLSTL